MSAPIDHQAAARAGVHRQHDEDVRPRYDGDSSLFPKRWDDLDPDRHVVACSENWNRPSESWGRKRVVCGDCKRLIVAGSWRELEQLMAEHLK